MCGTDLRCTLGAAPFALEDGAKRDERDGVDEITRLAGHTPACGGIVAIEMVTGTFQVTMMMRKDAPNLMDLMGGCVVVAAKGEIQGGCTLAEDVV